MASLGLSELQEMVGQAKRFVRILGVVPFDFDWESLAEQWLGRFREDSSFKVEILCESDNLLFAKSFTSDSDQARVRRSFRELRFIRDRALNELPDALRDMRAPLDKDGKPIFVKTELMHLPIPMSVVEFDDEFFAAPSLDEVDAPIARMEASQPWAQAIRQYASSYFDKKRGMKYAALHGEELLELFDHDRIPRGIYPRKSFYDTDYSQLVVWALIFDRKGRILIHRRKENAKDNRGMWDKSVGGHVDFALDVDTSRAVLREMIEELFVDEVKEGGFRPFAVTDQDTIFLGEWRPEQRGRNPFKEISKYHKEWAYFRLRNSQHVYTPRSLPDGSQRRLRVISDVFIVVGGPLLDDKLVANLKNSEYKLIDLSLLKNAMDSAIRNESVPGFDRTYEVPRFTPDLTNIMTGELRDVLEEFAQYIKRYLG